MSATLYLFGVLGLWGTVCVVLCLLSWRRRRSR